MSLTAERADELAAAIYEARRTRVAIAPLTEADPDLTMQDGYVVQQGVVRRYLEDGDRIVGYKLGLTSKPMQQMLGVGVARLRARHGLARAHRRLRRWRWPTTSRPSSRRRSRSCSARTSPARTARRSTSCARSRASWPRRSSSTRRIADWKIKLPDTVADMASSGAIVLSRPLGARRRRRPPRCSAWCSPATARSSRPAPAPRRSATRPPPSPGSSARCTRSAPRSPRAPCVMTGALHAAVPVAAGETYRAEFDRLGPVTVRIV